MTQISPGRFEVLPPVIKYLIIVNVVVWLLEVSIGRYFPMQELFALHDIHSTLFRPHQIITHIFMHDPQNPLHIILNMFVLWMFGKVLENLWGSKRFLTFYMICGLGSAALHMSVMYYHNSELLNMYATLSPEMRLDNNEGVLRIIDEPTVGASGAVFGCLAAFGYLFPNTDLYIYGLFPVKAKWLIGGYIGYELVMALMNKPGDNVAHFAHLGGALVGLILVIYWNKSNRNTFY
jgi:membrane associated rhomboid family serine protease